MHHNTVFLKHAKNKTQNLSRHTLLEIKVIYQVMVGGVRVIFGKRLGHTQRHTVCEDSHKDEDVKRSGGERSRNGGPFAG